MRPGGREHLKGRWANGTVSTFDAIYHDIVANSRIVYSYEMRLNDRKISVSLATLEIKPEGEKTRLVVTEQGAFLDGYEDGGSRERGTEHLLDLVGASLRRDDVSLPRIRRFIIQQFFHLAKNSAPNSGIVRFQPRAVFASSSGTTWSFGPRISQHQRARRVPGG